MSSNSNSSSASYQGLFGKMKSNNPVNGATKTVKVERTAEYSRGVRQMSNGFEKYNVSDEGAIYIAKAPESAFQNGGEAVAVKAENGKMVGLYRPQREHIIETVEEILESPKQDMFGDVKRGTEFEVQAFVGTFDNGIIKRKPTMGQR